jgi:hypothetical protein
MFEDYWHHDPDKRPQANFHRKRLNALFFWGLNNPRGDERDREGYESLRSLIGQVPYLNGGLFEKEADDETWFFPDEIVAKILNELIYRFNFTVAESTPMDVEVAVDPEMLGKIFEELVTGRHESGSYYTPKPVVSFMCREAIKGYLKTALPGEQAEAVERFVDETNPADLRDPETVLTALRSVKACDPACGSGAYLLGLLHELLDLRAALFVSRNVDAQTVYERKLEIIQNNLYGVDIDPFAVNIARLRLWLSLIVDYEGDDPPPLPNLDFKIEAGDSLTAPDPSGGLQPDLFRYNQVQRFLRLKNEFMTAHSGSEEKRALAEEIEALRDEIAAWAHPDGVDGFDWAVDFAEIFAPQLAEGTLGGKFTGVINAVPGQMELFERKRGSGFDIVLTNPPYVRQELITRELGADYKERLKDLYPHAYVGTADLYVAFYARAHQLLRSGGVGCFISSNKWLRAGYGENLRQHLLDEQAFHLVVDFGELPVFQSAATFPAIFLWQKQKRDQIPTQWAVVKDLQACYDEGIRDYVNRIGENLPANQFRNDKPRLVSPSTVELRRRMEASGPKLSEYIDDAIFFGIKTGRNKAFIIDQQTRDKLISRDPNNAEIIKPLLYGDNIRHYEIHFRKNYIIFARQGINIKKFPVIFKHLQKYRSELEPKPSSWNRTEQGKWPGRKSGNYAWYEIQDTLDYYALFEKPKILMPAFAKKPRFALEEGRFYFLGPAYFISTCDYYLLGVINSTVAFTLLQNLCSVLGDQDAGGRVVLRPIYFDKLPIPNASQPQRTKIAQLTKKAEEIHAHRRSRVEQFLHEIGTSPAETSSRNSLEEPWLLDEEDFKSRARRYGTPNPRVFNDARDETMALTEQIEEVEAEIDARVASLYGVNEQIEG